MAISVLGKRPRGAFDAEESENTSALNPRKRRQSRRLQPQIYEDPNQKTDHNGGNHDAAQVDSTSAREEHIHTELEFAANPAIPSRKGTGQPRSIESFFGASNVENIDPEPRRTPTTTRYRDVLLRRIPITPKHRIKAGQATARSSHSATPSPKSQNVYSSARQLFSQAGEPGQLVGRDAERRQLESFTETAIENLQGGCLYISGPPGTGKSALVHEVFQKIAQSKTVQKSVVNCVALRSPAEVVARMAEDFGVVAGKGRKPIKQLLGQLLTTKGESPERMHLVLLDEIDNLLDGDCEILYSIFEWALHKSSSLILIGIANALDLTDRFLPRLKQRDLKPALLPFMPYSATQMSKIIAQKLRSLLPQTSTTAPDFIPFLHPAAVQLCAKKIASQTGDLRKAFGLVRRAIDMIEHETLQRSEQQQDQLKTPSKSALKEVTNVNGVSVAATSSAKKAGVFDFEKRLVLSNLTVVAAPRASVAHMAKIASSVFNQGTVSRLTGLNLQQKAVLCSLVATEKRQQERDPYTTPSKKDKRVLSVADLYEKYTWLCKREDGILQSLKSSEFRDVVASLETLGLIHDWCGRSSSLLTPSKTPSRIGRNADEKQVVSCVSEREMRDSLTGPGADLLLRLFD